MAPSGDDFPSDAMYTTDNSDEFGYAEPGYNDGGFDDFGFPNLDSDGKYTNDFSGTSAACPVAAGVAGLVLSRNTVLTATDVRLILEHTAEMVSPDDAEYDGITGRSFTYGYGRVNALAAVEAADESTTNGGYTWPDRVASVEVRDTADAKQLRFVQSYGTDEFLIIEGDASFSFGPG